MNSIRVNRKSIGVNFTARGEAEILLWAPEAERVSLHLPSSDMKIDLIKQDYGYWSCISGKVKVGDRYFIQLDNEKYPDPASLSRPDGICGPSEIINLNAFDWTDYSWSNLLLENYIFYELHTGAFTHTGTFFAIEEKLDYLVNLGITAIELMPVAQFSGTRNWGYDGVFPFAVQNSYGGAIGLQHLINECHKKGLAVVLDVVYNHLGPEGNNLGKFGPYFTDKYKTPWGSAVNFDDAGCDAVRKFFIENVLMWFRDFHVDALRLDAVHAIKDFGPLHILEEIRQHVDSLMVETGKVHYLIAECDLNDVKYIQKSSNCGYGMDAQWVDEFHHALRVTGGNERNGYYEDFNGILHLAKSFHDGYVYDGMYSDHRKKKFGTRTEGLTGDKFIVFSQNHDQVGNRMLGERTSVLVSSDLQKVMAAAVILSPFLPFLFMGEEYGEKNPFQYFVNHSDPDLIKAVREGRVKEFAAFYNKEQVPDPQSENTFIKSKMDWERLIHPEHQDMLLYYRELIRWRKKLPALSNPDRSALEIKVFESQNTLLIYRWKDPHQVVYCLNFSDEDQIVEIDPVGEPWILAMHSLRENQIDKSSSFYSQESNAIHCPGESFLLFTKPYV